MSIDQSAKEFFVKAGSKGGKSTLKKLGKEHFSNIQKKRWADQKSKEKQKA